MYTESCTIDYLQRGGSNFDEQTHNYYKIRAGTRSSFDPLSPPAALYWSNAGQRSNDGDFSFDQAHGQHRFGTLVHFGSGAFLHPSRLSTMPPTPFNPPPPVTTSIRSRCATSADIASFFSAVARGSSKCAIFTAFVVAADMRNFNNTTAGLRQVIRTQPRRPG